MDLASLSPPDQVRAIAQDALNHLYQFQLHRGSYLSFARDNAFYKDDSIVLLNPSIEIPRDAPAADRIEDAKRHCRVCVLGACFCTYLALSKDVRLSFGSLFMPHGYPYPNPDRIVEVLLTIFSREQVDLINVAFEMEPDYSSVERPEQDPLVVGAAWFGYEASPIDSMVRARAILCNMVEHGEFCVPLFSGDMQAALDVLAAAAREADEDEALEQSFRR